MSVIFTPGYINCRTITGGNAIPPLSTVPIPYAGQENSRNWYNVGTYTFAPGIPGVYVISPQMYLGIGFFVPPTPLSATMSLRVKKNGSLVIASYDIGVSSVVLVAPVCVEYLSSTDYLTFEITNNDTVFNITMSEWATLSVILKDPDYYLDPPKPVCGLIKLSLPSNQSIPSGVLTVLDLLPLDDYRDDFDDVTHRFQPDFPGYYLVNANIQFGACATTLSRRSLEVWFNNTLYSKQLIPSRTLAETINATHVLYFNGVSDYVDFRVFQATGQPVVIDASRSYANALLFTADNYSLENVSQSVSRTVTATMTNVTISGNFEVAAYHYISDVNNDDWFDDDTGVFRPTIEGIYLLNVTAYSESIYTPGGLWIWVFKNAVFYGSVPAGYSGTQTNTSPGTLSANAFAAVYMNGTTDNLIIRFETFPGNVVCNGKLSFSLVTNNTITVV